jgi:hypothetical protein
MKSDNIAWAQHNGTERAVKDLLSTVPDSFIKTANDILSNGALTINVLQRLASNPKKHKDVEEYQNIVDVLRGTDYGNHVYFSYLCRAHFKRLVEAFSVHEDLSVLR